jgi:hypothetical protein
MMKANLLKRGKSSKITPLPITYHEPDEAVDSVVDVIEDAVEDALEPEEQEDAAPVSPGEALKRPTAPAYDIRKLLDPSASTLSESLAYGITDTVERLEKAITVQGAMLLKIAERAVQTPPPATVTVEAAPASPGSFRVAVIRDRSGAIAELVVTPVGDN